ncbi:hypothetical protein [Streptomyces sp. Ac-502]|uniref:hypothetical protein n=1 Tax=Streptomyces sp. Ac-502 TaxID=3342801 RepID=UPI003862B260
MRKDFRAAPAPAPLPGAASPHHLDITEPDSTRSPASIAPDDRAVNGTADERDLTWRRSPT